MRTAMQNCATGILPAPHLPRSPPPPSAHSKPSPAPRRAPAPGPRDPRCSGRVTAARHGRRPLNPARLAAMTHQDITQLPDTPPGTAGRRADTGRLRLGERDIAGLLLFADILDQANRCLTQPHGLLAWASMWPCLPETLEITLGSDRGLPRKPRRVAQAPSRGGGCMPSRRERVGRLSRSRAAISLTAPPPRAC